MSCSLVAAKKKSSIISRGFLTRKRKEKSIDLGAHFFKTLFPTRERHHRKGLLKKLFPAKKKKKRAVLSLSC